MSLTRHVRGVRALGGFAGGTSRLARPPQVLEEADVRPLVPGPTCSFGVIDVWGGNHLYLDPDYVVPPGDPWSTYSGDATGVNPWGVTRSAIGDEENPWYSWVIPEGTWTFTVSGGEFDASGVALWAWVSDVDDWVAYAAQTPYDPDGFSINLSAPPGGLRLCFGIPDAAQVDVGLAIISPLSWELCVAEVICYSVDVEPYAGVLSGSVVLDQSTEVNASAGVGIDPDEGYTIVFVPAGRTIESMEGLLGWEPNPLGSSVTVQIHVYSNPDFDELLIFQAGVGSGGSGPVTVLGTEDYLFFGDEALPFVVPSGGVWVGIEVSSAGTTTTQSGGLTICTSVT